VCFKIITDKPVDTLGTSLVSFTDHLDLKNILIQMVAIFKILDDITHNLSKSEID